MQRDVLEGQRRPMEQLQQEPVGCDFDQRRNIFVRKIGIGRVDIGAKLLRRESIADKIAKYARGDLGIRRSGKPVDFVVRYSRPLLGHI